MPLAGRQSNDTSPSPHSNTFTKFNELPAELRQLIWEAALPPPRIILLEHKRRKFDPTISQFIPRIDRLGFRSDAPAPHILLACREAYTIASLHYTRAFSNKTGTSLPEVYFSFRDDFLYLGPEWLGSPHESEKCYQERVCWVLEHELPSEDLARVQNLAVWSSNDVVGRNSPNGYLDKILCHFGNVKHVAIVSNVCGAFDSDTPSFADVRFLRQTRSSEPSFEMMGLTLPDVDEWVTDEESKVDLDMLRRQSMISWRRPKTPSTPKGWDPPTIEYNVLVTAEGEQYLMERARIAKEEGLA
jgi:2EXR family